jgi:hypothetical protein
MPWRESSSGTFNSEVMKNGILCLLLLGAMATGYVLGRHTGARTQPPPERPGISSSDPSSKKSDSVTSESEASASRGKLSLAEIEEKIRGLKVLDYRFGIGAPRAWLDLFDQISAADMPEVLDFVGKNCARDLAKSVRLAVLTHWVDIDPRGAVAYAGHLSDARERESAVRIVMTVWAANDPKAAVAWAKQAGPSRTEMLRAVISAIATSDPKAAFDLYQSNRDSLGTVGFQAYPLFQTILGAWAAKDPTEAAAMVDQLPLGDRSIARQVIASAWAQDDPRAAMAWAAKVPSAADRDMLTHNILMHWGADDPSGAAEFLRDMPDSRGKALSILQVGRQLAERDPKDALSLAETVSGDSFAQEDLIKSAMRSWANQDQAGALAYAQNLPAGQERDRALAPTLSAVAMKDPKLAYSLVGMLTSEQAQTDVTRDVASGIAQTDPQGALTFATQNLKSQGLLNIFINNMAGDWLAKDPETAKNWWQNVPAGPSRQSYLDGLVTAMLQTSIADAADFIAGLPPGREQGSAVGSLMFRWSHDDPEGAAKWAATLTDPKSQMAAYQNLILGWAHENPEGTSAWISGLPDETTRQALAQTFVSYIGVERPSIAAPWAASLTDADERNKAIQRVATSWMQTDAASARAWLATTSLPDSLKQSLLQPTSTRPAPFE